MDATTQLVLPKPIVTLSDEYCQGVTLAGELAATNVAAVAAPAPAAAAAASATSVDAEDGKVYCRVSGIWLESAAALREHCHTDWYRFNVQRSARGMPPVTEEQFEELVESDALGDELSGSDDDDDDDADTDGARSAASRPDGRIALRDASGAVFLVWRAALLPAGAAAADVPLGSLPQCLGALARARPAPVWVVVLCRGGHFAAAVMELVEPPRASRRPEDAVKLLAHKCLHRYVTRRKAGGRQSVADASKSIKSAGARR